MAYKDLTFLLFAKDMSASRGFEKVAASGDAMAVGLKGSLGIAGVAIAGLAISIGAKSVKMAADFQTATTRLVTDAGESSKTIGQLSNGLLDISANTGTSATEIAQGMYKVSSAGYTMANGGLKVMAAAAEGAKIGGADLSTVADALTTVMKDYGIGAGQANNTTSELIETVSLGKTTMEDLAGSLHSVLPNAQALGISLSDVLGSLATMTQEGISADQATQNLNHTIVSLANPTHQQTLEMAAMGLNSTKVAQQLGKKGLTGTLDELVNAITSHMGKGGLVLQKAFTNSALAAQSANKEFGNLPTKVKTLASAYANGSISLKTWNTAVKNLPADQANLAKQWATTENKAKGFSDTLKSGSGNAQTFTSALAKMTGGQTGLQVALHITGIHAKDAADAVKKIGDASKGTQKDVKDWNTIQGTFNQKMSEWDSWVGKVGIKIGTVLLPAIGDFTSNLIDGAREWGVFFHNLEDGWNQSVAAFKHEFGLIVTYLKEIPPQVVKIGGEIVEGLINGITGNWGGVVSTIGRLAGSIPTLFKSLLQVNSPSKVMIPIGSAIGEGMEKGILGSTAQVATASSKMVNAVKAAFKAGDISSSAEGSLLKTIGVDAKSLESLSGSRAALQTKLGNLKSSRTGVHDDTKSATVGYGDITGFAAPGDAVQGLGALVTKTKTFTADLKSLMKKGVSGTMLTQLVDGWNSDPDTALATANGLLSNPTDLKQILSLEKALSTAGGALGAVAGHGEYDSQINATQGKIKVDTWRMQQIARAEAKRVAGGLNVTVNLSGTYAGTKESLAKSIAQLLKDEVKKGTIPKNWATG